MNARIIADSCCDITPELKERFGVTMVPLTIDVGDQNFVDDETLDIPTLMSAMKNYAGRIGTAAPSPSLYAEAYKGEFTSFVVTLSSRLSGSYASAMLGKTMAEEEFGADVHVFDSLSATAGEVLTVLKIRQMIDEGLQKAQIVAYIENFIREMKTFFVLDSVENLLKNGRLNKIVGKLVTMLHIKPLMGADGDGNIALFSHARGQNQIVEKMTDTVAKSGKSTEGQSMVITHCNNQKLADRIMNAVKERYHFKEILIVPTRGISSVYAYDKGIVMAY
jgi:DegV family protein with EDD domain